MMRGMKEEWDFKDFKELSIGRQLVFVLFVALYFGMPFLFKALKVSMFLCLVGAMCWGFWVLLGV